MFKIRLFLCAFSVILSIALTPADMAYAYGGDYDYNGGGNSGGSGDSGGASVNTSLPSNVSQTAASNLPGTGNGTGGQPGLVPAVSTDDLLSDLDDLLEEKDSESDETAPSDPAPSSPVPTTPAPTTPVSPVPPASMPAQPSYNMLTTDQIIPLDASPQTSLSSAGKAVLSYYQSLPASESVVASAAAKDTQAFKSTGGAAATNSAQAGANSNPAARLGTNASSEAIA